jgi:hypothetical protein
MHHGFTGRAYTILFQMRFLTPTLRCLALAVLLAGCGSGPPLTVSSIQLGRSLNADGTVGSFSTTFAPTDTVYVVVLTAGAGDATFSVRWIHAGRVLDEPKKQVSLKDRAATAFHLQSATGFPPGDYTVEVLMNGQPIGTRQFTVGNR